MYVFKIINPDVSNKIKSFLNTLINTDENSIMNIISNSIKFIKNKLNVGDLKVLNNFFEEATKYHSLESPIN